MKAHNQPLNGNLKAYAAWWLWGRLAGWKGTPADVNSFEKENVNIRVYPNPISDILHISVSNSLLNGILSVVDVNGKLIKKIQVTDIYKQSIHIENLKTGYYFITSAQGDVVKFLKK